MEEKVFSRAGWNPVLAGNDALEFLAEGRLREHIAGRLPWAFRITFAYVDEIPRNAGGKFENFVSELAS